ncbi:MAG: YhdP family protein [Pseudomonadota bacterium]
MHRSRRAAIRARLLRKARVLRAIRWIALGSLSIVTAFTAGWQGYVRPHFPEYQPHIEAWLSKTLNVPVHIKSIEAGWDQVFPEVRFSQICLDTPHHPCALGAQLLRISIKWWAPWQTHRIYIEQPHGTLQREKNGKLTLAGLPLQAEQDTDPSVLFEHLLNQRYISITNGLLIWNDLTGRTRQLRLTNVEASFDNHFTNHTFKFYARPTPSISAPLEGEFHFRPMGFKPQLSQLYGQGYLRLPKLELAAWTPYVSELNNPIHKGTADINFSFDIQSGRLRYLKTNLDMQHLEGTLNKETIHLRQIKGDILWSESGDLKRGYRGTLTTQNLAMNACNGCINTPLNLEARLLYQTALQIEGAYLKIDALDLPSISLLAQHIPIPRIWRAQFQRRLIQGTIDHLEAHWNNPRSPFLPDRFNIDLKNVGWHSLEQNIPSLKGLSASIIGTPEAGTITLNSSDTQIEWPWLWSRFPDINKLEGQLSWKKSPHLNIALKNIRIDTADGFFTLRGTFSPLHSPKEPGWMQLEGTASLNHAPRLLPYLPLTLPHPLLDWLTQTLEAGKSSAQWRVQGTPHNFPFAEGSPKEFIHIDIDTHHAKLRFAPTWPVLENVSGRVSLHKNRIDIVADRLQTQSLELVTPATISITGLETQNPQFDTHFKTQGSITAGLAYLRSTPMREHIPSLFNSSDIKGHFLTSLKINFPIKTPEKAHFESFSEFNNASTTLSNMPSLTEAHGTLSLNEQGLILSRFEGKLNNEPIQFSVTPHLFDGFSLSAEGNLTPNTLTPWVKPSLSSFFTGQGRWMLNAHLGNIYQKYELFSTLKGIQSSLPAPLAKQADTEKPLYIEFEKINTNKSSWWIKVPDAGFQTRWASNEETNGSSRGHILLGYCRPQPVLPIQGWHVSGQIDGKNMDLPGWLEQRDRLSNSFSMSPKSLLTKPASETWSLPALPLRIDLSLINMESVHPILNQSTFHWKSQPTQAQAQLINSYMSAEMLWKDDSHPFIDINIAHLDIPANEKTDIPANNNSSILKIEAHRPPIGLPPVNMIINQLSYGNVDLGSLKIEAHSEGNAIEIPVFNLSYPDSSLKAVGYWSALGFMHWEGIGTFENTGNLLKRLKLYEGLKNGSGTIKGALQWEGLTPLSNPKSLGGSLELDFKNGQFTQVEPGLAKLLGLSSLQSIPKRLSLDFRDIFSQGFLFNRVSGNMTFERAILRTPSPIKLEGDSANLQIQGYTNLVNETQDFKIQVLPNLSTNIAAATAFLINPLVGGATFFAQKVLQDPFEKAFSYHYSVTGTWSDPVIKSLGRGKPKSSTTPEGNG